eukprot:CAMPEP_0196583198 /NCGR_PEP_ID=MMETSP1081-20130531/42487_1 /TAXON_ID=36882 /ORGANISM="Pyramimonas amylifera, Strain CCMP720" /LENGTH=306 /DNA_ID=CAMNT_0041904009 /DNA_START=298 /DNA_END=1218 /DNA_ORIENTATION=-
METTVSAEFAEVASTNILPLKQENVKRGRGKSLINGLASPHSSKYRGVSFDKHHNRWKARIFLDGKQRALGYYDNQEGAARAYDKQAFELFGFAAQTNFNVYDYQKPQVIAQQTEGDPTVSNHLMVVPSSPALASVAGTLPEPKARKNKPKSKANVRPRPAGEEATARTSKYRGVSWDKAHNRWKTRIFLEGKQRSLGYYPDEETAARAYDKRSIELFGSEAMTNFAVGYEALAVATLASHSLANPQPLLATPICPLPGSMMHALQGGFMHPVSTLQGGSFVPLPGIHHLHNINMTGYNSSHAPHY